MYLKKYYNNKQQQIAENARAAEADARYVAWQQAEAMRLAQAKLGIVELSKGINPEKHQ